MDSKSQEMFDTLVAMDQESLTEEQVGFLMARRDYFNDEHRKRYADLIDATEAKLKGGDLSSLTLPKLKTIAADEGVDVTGLKTKEEFVAAISAAREAE